MVENYGRLASVNLALDSQRFRNKLEDIIRKDLKSHITYAWYLLHNDDEKRLVTLKIPQLPLPRFKEQIENIEIWRGDGQPGDSWGYLPEKKIQELNVEFELEKLVDILIERLNLPEVRLQNDKNSNFNEDFYSTVRKRGLSLHRGRTLKESLKRHLSSGNYHPGNQIVIEDKDKRRIAAKKKESTDSRLVIIYMMGKANRGIVGTEIFWLDEILGRKYKEALAEDCQAIKRRYILYSNFSVEVSRKDFLGIKLSGMPLENVGYQKVLELIEEEKKLGQENIFVFHYSGGVITKDEQGLIVNPIKKIIKQVNIFAYTQVRSGNKKYSLGPNEGLKGFLEKRFVDDIGLGNLSLSYIENNDKKEVGEEIINSIKNKFPAR